MNNYRIQIRTTGGSWTYIYITARTPFDARDIAVSAHGSDVMGYAELVL